MKKLLKIIVFILLFITITFFTVFNNTSLASKVTYGYYKKLKEVLVEKEIIVEKPITLEKIVKVPVEVIKEVSVEVEKVKLPKWSLIIMAVELITIVVLLLK